MTGPEPVATFWAADRASYVASDWRCEAPARRLPAVGPLFLEDCGSLRHVRFGDRGCELRMLDVFLARQQGGAQVWRNPIWREAGLAIHEAKTAGVRVVVDVDDLFTDPTAPFAGRWGNPLFADVAAEVRAVADARYWHANTVRSADAVICNTDALAAEYRKINPNVYVVPYAVAPEDWPPLDKPTDGVFRVGVAGGKVRVDDYQLVRDALRWVSQQPGCEAVVIGANPRTDPTMGEWAGFQAVRFALREGSSGELVSRYEAWRAPVDERKAGWRFGFRHVPFELDAQAYRRALQQLDVGLCPNLRSAELPRWRRGSVDTKALEYSMAGALPICSGTSHYAAWRDRFTRSPSAPAEWLEAVRWAVANRDEVRRLAAEARAYVLAERTIEQTVGLWREAVCPLTG